MSKEYKAEIGRKIAETAKQTNLNLPANVLSNWRNGHCLPTLEKFLLICARSNSLDFKELLEITDAHAENLQNF